MASKGLTPGEDVPERGWPAVQHFLRYCTGMLQPGEKAPPMPEGISTWPETVLPGALAGALHGGVTQWMDGRPVPAYSATPSPSFTLQRAFRVLDAANRRGLALGGMAALYFGVEMLASVYRGRRAYMRDAALGGLAVGAVFAAHRSVRTPTWPPPDLAGNVAIIIGIGLVQGFLQKVQAEERQKEADAAVAAEEERQRLEAAAARKQDAAWALLAQLEAQLSGGAAPKQQQGEAQQQQLSGDGATKQQEQQQQRGQWQQEAQQQQQREGRLPLQLGTQQDRW